MSNSLRYLGVWALTQEEHVETQEEDLAGRSTLVCSYTSRKKLRSYVFESYAVTCAWNFTTYTQRPTDNEFIEIPKSSNVLKINIDPEGCPEHPHRAKIAMAG